MVALPQNLSAWCGSYGTCCTARWRVRWNGDWNEMNEFHSSPVDWFYDNVSANTQTQFDPLPQSSRRCVCQISGEQTSPVWRKIVDLKRCIIFFGFGGRRILRREWSGVMSQKIDFLWKEENGSCDWQSETEASIQPNADCDQWLGKRNLQLRRILWEICSNTYADWKERNPHYQYGVCHIVKLGTFWNHVSVNKIAWSISILVHTYEYERPKEKCGVRNNDFIDDKSRVCMALVKKVARWRPRRASKLAPRHHTLPQKWEAHGGRAPMWIDIFVSRRRWETHLARLEVEWRTTTWVCDSPSQGEGVDNKTLSQRHCVVVDHLNKFGYSFQMGLTDLSKMLLWCGTCNLYHIECPICDFVYRMSIMLLCVKSHLYVI